MTNVDRRRLSGGARVLSWNLGSATPFVLLHGFTGRAESWRDVASKLSAPAHALDLFGHGRPVAEASWSANIERLRQEVLEIHPRPHVVGYSFGGRLALGLLAQSHDFASVTVIGAHPGLGTDDEKRARREQDAHWISILENQGMDAFVEAWSKLPIFSSQLKLPDNVLEAQDQLRRRNNPRELAAALRVLGLAEMPRVDVPRSTRYIAGALDAKYTLIGQALSDHFVSVAEAGHNVVLEQPGVLAQTLISTHNKRHV